MVNPRTDCTIIPEDHARDRRVQRGLAYPDLVRVIRKGAWAPREDGLWDVTYGTWRARLEIGQCHLFIVTIIRL